MDKVTILIEGFAKMNSDDTWEATSTTTLIESKDKKVIMDPGCERKLLEDAFKKHDLKFEDIDLVFLSHRHLDHSVLTGIFPNATTYDDLLHHKGSHGQMNEETIPETNIKIIKTPGHAPMHGSLLVDTDEGVIAVAGDVFWWYEEEKQILDIDKKDDSMDGSMKDLKNSRKLLLEKSDWIIPGHGKKIKVVK